LFDEDLDALRDFKPPRHARYALVSSLDGISHLRRDVHGLLSEEDTRRKVFFERGAKEAGSLSDLENHAILDRGRLVGLWDFDVESASIVWMSFIPKDKDLVEAVARTERFVRDELGDARSFSLDSPKSRSPRIQALRRLSTA
jgi:hypothetical protein